VNSTYAELVRDMPIVQNTMDQSDDITQLVPSDDGDYVYALTAQQVSYIAVIDSYVSMSHSWVHIIAKCCN